MLAVLRFVSISDWKIKKKVLKHIMKISCMCTFKKVDMHEIFMVYFYNFFCIFQSLIDIKRSTVNIFKNVLQIRQDIRSFRLLAVFAESGKRGWAFSPKTRS